MKKITSFFIVFISLILGSSISAFEDQTTHPHFTKRAIKYCSEKGVANCSYLFDRSDVIAQGATDEDKGSRFYCHFSPVLTYTGLINGQTDAITWGFKDVAVKKCNPDADNRNHYKWDDALYAATIDDRHLSLGHVLHLLQDMAVPAHVRDDGHGALTLHGLGSNDPLENYAAINDGTFSLDMPPGYDLIVDKTPEELFLDLSSYIKTHYFSDDTCFDTHVVNSPTSCEEDDHYFYTENPETGKCDKKIAHKGAAYWLSCTVSVSCNKRMSEINNIIATEQFNEIYPKAIQYSASLAKTYADRLNIIDKLELSTHIFTKHFLAYGYYLDFVLYDPQKMATEVKLTGDSIGTIKLVYYNDRKMWVFENYSLGLTKPTSDLFYTFYITTQGLTTSVTKKITGYVDIFAQNLSPSGTVTGAFDFSWQGSCFDGYYVVDLIDSNNKLIWQHFTKDSSETKVPYTGPALVGGETYYYNIQLRIKTNGEENFSLNTGSFTYSTSGNGYNLQWLSESQDYSNGEVLGNWKILQYKDANSYNVNGVWTLNASQWGGSNATYGSDGSINNSVLWSYTPGGTASTSFDVMSSAVAFMFQSDSNDGNVNVFVDGEAVLLNKDLRTLPYQMPGGQIMFGTLVVSGLPYGYHTIMIENIDPGDTNNDVHIFGGAALQQIDVP